MTPLGTAALRDVSPAPLRFSTKAETLEQLRGRLQHARVLPQHCFRLDTWTRDPEAVLDAIERYGWATGTLIVRSSCHAEDSTEQSCAGRYESVPNVVGRASLARAIDQVRRSYDAPVPHDLILVQPMLRDVQLSGVAFTADPTTGGAYYVINYDDESGKTDSVTSGRAARLRTYYRYKASTHEAPIALRRILRALEELEGLFQCSRLDVEFCTVDDQLFVLQVRPLTSGQPHGATAAQVQIALLRLESDLRQRQEPQYGLCGERTVFGVMPDWNPAEIIGLRPRPLALSLYRELVTDAIWAYQRDNYGYRNLRSHPLMVSFHGIPYIDVRVSANSFIPKDLDDELAARLTDFYIEQLIRSPERHDKLEFDVLFTCYTLDLPERLSTIEGFSEAEKQNIAASLRNLTTRIIDNKSGIWRQDLAKIQRLEHKISQIEDRRPPPVSHAYWLLEDCKRYGTLPFAGLARAGFIAVQLLDSLVNIGVLTQRERGGFMNSLDTVSGRMNRDFASLERSDFLRRYGHLRPGCYDILSPRYDEAPDRYFDWSRDAAANHAPSSEFRLSLVQYRQMQELLVEHGLGDDVLGLFEFIKGAIEGREHAKFVFTRCVSQALSILEQLGDANGISREELSYADARIVRELYTSCDDPGASLRESIRSGAQRYRMTQALSLPELIVDPKDVWGFHMLQCSPNYVTLGTAVGPVVGPDDERARLRGAIVMIPSADPGYDWIFTCEIAGFVTMYGGVNSHMAIRAAEFGIPAVIGAGQRAFDTWRSAAGLHIDCENRSVRRMGQ